MNPGSKAERAGLREGDVISVLNGARTRTMTNNEAVVQLKKDEAVLGLNQKG